MQRRVEIILHFFQHTRYNHLKLAREWLLLLNISFFKTLHLG